MTFRAGWAYLLLVLVVLAGATALRVADPFAMQALRLIAFDSYQRIDPQDHDPTLPVRIVDIDEESLARVGQWPWPRTTMARLLEMLRDPGAAAVSFDVLFAEPARHSPEQVLSVLPPAQAAAVDAARPGAPAMSIGIEDFFSSGALAAGAGGSAPEGMPAGGDCAPTVWTPLIGVPPVDIERSRSRLADVRLMPSPPPCLSATSSASMSG